MFGIVFGVNFNAGFTATKRYIYAGTFESHQGGKSFNLISWNVRGKSYTWNKIRFRLVSCSWSQKKALTASLCLEPRAIILLGVCFQGCCAQLIIFNCWDDDKNNKPTRFSIVMFLIIIINLVLAGNMCEVNVHTYSAK